MKPERQHISRENPFLALNTHKLFKFRSSGTTFSVVLMFALVLGRHSACVVGLLHIAHRNV